MFKKFIYVIFLLLVVIAATEYGLRLKGSYLTYSEQTRGVFTTDYATESVNLFHLQSPNRTYNLDHGEFNYEYSINSIGFREREFTTDVSKLKVFVFGDSYTEGVGAPYDSTWPRQLERMLVSDFGNAEVFVCGVSGADPFFNYAVLRNVLPYKPTHVIFSVNTSDLHDYSVRGGMSRYFRKVNHVVYKDPPWYYNLYRKSHLARMAFIEWFDFDHNLIPLKKWPAISEEAADSIVESLWWANENCFDEAVKFLTVLHPNPREACSNPDIPDLALLNERMGELEYIDISGSMFSVMNGPDCQSFFWPVDGHYNSKGYEVMGEVVYHEISSQKPGFWSSPYIDEQDLRSP